MLLCDVDVNGPSTEDVVEGFDDIEELRMPLVDEGDRTLLGDVTGKDEAPGPVEMHEQADEIADGESLHWDT